MRLQHVCKHGCDILDLLVFFENYVIEVMEHFCHVYIVLSKHSGKFLKVTCMS